MRADDIRSGFLEFFGSRGHQKVASAPLVPQNDPSLLFVNAGMVPFKDVFVGRDRRDYTRATTAQRCLRAGGKHNDLDNVGFTPRHHTLFEMMGNFSFGDYFKKDAIAWAWEFLTEGLGLPAERLVVSIFNGEGENAPYDQEAHELWQAFVPADRIYAFDAKENFWQMADTGPCGPCSEIHIFHGDKAPPDATREGQFGPAYEDDRYMELWNLVFMQYEKHADASLTPLPKPSIDTGAGLERLATVVEGVHSNYENGLLKPLVDRAKGLAGRSGAQGDDEPPFQVIADHARATAFLIADGVFPDRAGRSYVLRRIMRRAIRYGTRVGLDKPFFHEMTQEVVDRFSEAYPELTTAKATIDEVVRTEEESFRRTLGRGLRRLEGALGDLDQGTKVFPVAVAAELYDTDGFPIDLTGIIAKERGLALDEDAVAQEVKRRQAGGSGRLSGSDTGVADIYFEVAQSLDSRFVGYTEDTGETSVVALLSVGTDGGLTRVEQAAAGDLVEVVLESTPFYAESGGPIGDVGTLGGEGLRVEVLDCQKPTGTVHFHRARIESGVLRVGQTVTTRVEPGARAAIKRNHSATHLLHFALREVLGDHVTQKGSLVDAARLRFDFSHGRPLTAEQRQAVERIVNEHIIANVSTSVADMDIEQAKASGAMMLFGEKYGDTVRVVNIGPQSVELCGGLHVSRSGDIGLMLITSEGGIAQGVRRIEAITGPDAVAHVHRTFSAATQASDLLHAKDAGELVTKVERLRADLKEKDRQVADLQRKLATGGSSADAIEEVQGVKLLAKVIGAVEGKAMREAADTLRDRLGTGVVVLAATKDGKANLLVAVTKDLTKKVHAGKLVGELAKHVDGRGGGRPDLAQAGGPNVDGLDAAVGAAAAALAQQLGA